MKPEPPYTGIGINQKIDLCAIGGYVMAVDLHSIFYILSFSLVVEQPSPRGGKRLNEKRSYECNRYFEFDTQHFHIVRANPNTSNSTLLCHFLLTSSLALLVFGLQKQKALKIRTLVYQLKFE
jgi:hypothetical protein